MVMLKSTHPKLVLLPHKLNQANQKLEALFEGIPQAAAVDLKFCPVNRTA